MPEDSSLRGWVRTAFGDSAVPLDGLAARSPDFDSLLLCRPGQEPGEFSAEQFSVSRFMIDPDDNITFGTAPMERPPGQELGLRLASGEIVWTASVGGRVHPPTRAPATSAAAPSTGEEAADAAWVSERDEIDRIEEARQQRLRKHPQLRELLAWLVQTKCSGSQAALARKLQLRPAFLSEYNTQMARSVKLTSTQLNTYHAKISAAILAAELPTMLPLAEPGLATPSPSTNASLPRTQSKCFNNSIPPPTAPPKSNAPVAVLTLNLSEVAGHQGGQVLILDVGQVQEQDPDPRWMLNVKGTPLRLRPGLRARYTFGVRSSALGGRTFEWWIETLVSDAELNHNGGPLWVAREVTGKAAIHVSAVHARSDVGARIIGRAVAAASPPPDLPAVPPPPPDPPAARPQRASAAAASSRWSGQDEPPAAAPRATSQGKRKAAAPPAADPPAVPPLPPEPPAARPKRARAAAADPPAAPPLPPEPLAARPKRASATAASSHWSGQVEPPAAAPPAPSQPKGKRKAAAPPDAAPQAGKRKAAAVPAVQAAAPQA